MNAEALLDLFVLAPIGLVECDADGRVAVANLAARRLLTPFTRAEALDNLFDALAAVAPDLPARVRGFEAPRGVALEALELLAPGTSHGVSLALLRTAPDRYVAVIHDAGTLAQARRTIGRLEQQLLAVDGAVREYAFCVTDGAGRITQWGAAAERVFQWPAPQVIGEPLARLLPADGDPAAQVADALALAARNGWCEEEGQRRRRDGSSFWATTIVTALRDGDGTVSGFSVVVRDLSERRRLDEAGRDEAAATIDYLTGVATRRAWFDVATAEISRARRYEQPLTMLLVDPDRFDDVRAAEGQPFADEWLKAIAWVCRQESRTTDVVGRVAGHQFAVLLPSTELSGGLVLAERIRERMQRHVFPGERQGVRCTVCVGVAEITDQIATVDDLFDAAASAVAHARQAGSNLVVGHDA